jgi:hypothetical protein
MGENLTNAKTAGAIQHVISSLHAKGIIDDNYRDNLKREIGYRNIVGFRHLAEYLLANRTIGTENYDAIMEYGKRFGAS